MRDGTAGPHAAGTLLGGKYRLSRRIGQGAMGAVWAAVNQDTSREVAVKLILGSEPELRQRLMREAKSCGALKHPNVIDIYDVAQTASGEPFLVMELLTGETLSQLLTRKRRLEPMEAARIALAVARALEAAHALGIVHRDLKPANIFLQRTPGEGEPIVKVLDFGVAKNVTSDDGLKTSLGNLVGSPAYMSPEQAGADSTVDHQSDIWSLGILLFQMLAGVRPFTGESHLLLPKIIKGPIPTLRETVRDADPMLSEIIARCLKRDRKHRIRSATEIANLLGPIASGRTSQGGGALLPGRAGFASSPDGRGMPGMGQGAGQGAGQGMGQGALASVILNLPATPPARAGADGSPLSPRSFTPNSMPAAAPDARLIEGVMRRPGSSPHGFGSPVESPLRVHEEDAATARIEPRMVANFVRQPASPVDPPPGAGGAPDVSDFAVTAVLGPSMAKQWLPAPTSGSTHKVPLSSENMTPRGTIKIEAADAERLRARLDTAESSTAPLIRPNKGAPGESAPGSTDATTRASKERRESSPRERRRERLALGAAIVGVLCLVITIVYIVVIRGGAAPQNEVEPELRPIAAVVNTRPPREVPRATPAVLAEATAEAAVDKTLVPSAPSASARTGAKPGPPDDETRGTTKGAHYLGNPGVKSTSFNCRTGHHYTNLNQEAPTPNPLPSHPVPAPP
jgi:serine/threonine-protein kinase